VITWLDERPKDRSAILVSTMHASFRPFASEWSALCFELSCGECRTRIDNESPIGCEPLVERVLDNGIDVTSQAASALSLLYERRLIERRNIQCAILFSPFLVVLADVYACVETFSSIRVYVCEYSAIGTDWYARAYLLAEEGCLLVYYKQDITEAGVYAA